MHIRIEEGLKYTQTSTVRLHSFSVARRHTHTHTLSLPLSLSLYQIGKQILSKTLLLQEIVKALASLSEYVVFVNT